jgi:DtxR family transcriptional regulator, Mn-dependent transcriptional regulator
VVRRGARGGKVRSPLSDLIDTTEMYLRTIFELEEEGIVALRARIAERLGHSGPTVSQTVARMERDGLLHVSGDRHLELTEAGRRKAMRVMRKHRLAERLLLDVIGLEWQFVHEEACRWEHVMSERVERKLFAMLGGVLESPYGNPIPGLDELGGPDAVAPGFRDGVRSLTDALAATPVPGRLVVRRLGETIQTDADLMARLAAAGVMPGSGVSATRQGDTLSIRGEAGEISVPLAVATHVFVVAEVAA